MQRPAEAALSRYGVWAGFAAVSVLMTNIGYAGYRFPPVIIQQAVWLCLVHPSFRDVEDLLAERGSWFPINGAPLVKHSDP